MALTREFKETVAKRVQTDPTFGDELLTEGIQALLDDDVEVGKSLIRDYINATTGFTIVAEDLGQSPKSVMRMFGAKGNPRAKNLFAVIRALQQRTGRSVFVETRREDDSSSDRTEHPVTA